MTMDQMKGGNYFNEIKVTSFINLDAAYLVARSSVFSSIKFSTSLLIPVS